MGDVEDNISWESPLDVLDGWEPWEDDEDEDRPAGGCAYCDSAEVRELPEPFGGRPCCEECFLDLIGDESPRPRVPWRCGTTAIVDD